MTGGPGYIRAGEVPYREIGSREPAEAFAVLLEAGANPDAKAPNGSSLLHLAVGSGNLDIIRTLGAAGVDFDQPNDDNLTALDVAEGKRPEGDEGDEGAEAEGGRGAGAGGRGGRGRAPDPEIGVLLRELMGLPPAPPAPPPASLTSPDFEAAPPLNPAEGAE